MPLYRRGPGFLEAQLHPPAWSLHQAYGPPDDREAPASTNELDLRLFSVYFLVAESLATFVGYRITQHCLRGCRVWFLSPSARMWIGFFYCSLKISLINYAFHGSVYFTGTLCIMVLYAVTAVMALGFHLGPLQFLFFDYIPKNKMTRSLYHRMAAVCQQVSSRLEFYALQRWLALPPVLDDSNVVVSSASLVANDSRKPPASIQSPPTVGFSRVNGFFGRELVVNISQWNLSVCAQWTPTLISSGRCSAVALEGIVDSFETRFLFMMQHDGLLLGFILMSPTATLMTKLRASGNAVPFEIVLRFHCRRRSDVASSIPLFFYAHSAVLFGGATPAQSAYIYELLRALNAASGRVVDVPLRSLRCKNFIDAGVGRIVKKKARRQGILSEMDSNSFL